MSDRSYDELWRSTWGDMQHWGPVHRHSMRNITRTITSLPDVQSILDVGCGSGINLLPLVATGKYTVTGTDLSEEALKLARERVPSVKFFKLDIEHESLPEKADLVMSHQVIEHIVDDIAAIRNLARMSKRYVYVSSMQGRMRKSEIPIGHFRNYSPLELTRKLEAVGLRVLWVKGWGFPFYSPLYRTVAEWLPGGPPTGSMSPATKKVAGLLYHLYKLNVPGKGDVISALAEHPPAKEARA